MEIQISREGNLVDHLQRRRAPRIRLQVPVFVRGAGTSGMDFIELAKTVNISASGACIATEQLLRTDQIIHLTFPAPSAASSSAVPNETPPIAARVLRQDVVGETRLFGLEFLKPIE